jgi:hypothetical protein
MIKTQQATALRASILSPVVTAAFGFVVYALSIISGGVFEANSDSRVETAHSHTFWESATSMAPEFAIGLVGAAIAVWAGRRAWRAQPPNLTRSALVLAVVAAVTVPAFWAGWSNIFGAVAAGLALESRRRVGSLGAQASTALFLGSAAFVVGGTISLLG